MAHHATLTEDIRRRLLAPAPPPTIGKLARIPIYRRSAWDDAVAWLQQRQAAREEWAWPER